MKWKLGGKIISYAGRRKKKSKIFIGDGRTLHSNFVIVYMDVYVLVTKTHSLFKK